MYIYKSSKFKTITAVNVGVHLPLIQQGLSLVARTLNISRSSVRRVYKGSGRNRVTSEREDRFIVLASQEIDVSLLIFSNSYERYVDVS